jgi:hypothetical protein
MLRQRKQKPQGPLRPASCELAHSVANGGTLARPDLDLTPKDEGKGAGPRYNIAILAQHLLKPDQKQVQMSGKRTEMTLWRD